MRRYGEPLFSQGDISNHLRSCKEAVTKEIREKKEDYLIKVGEAQFVEYMVDSNMINELTMYLDHAEVEEREEMIPDEYFPSTFFVREGKSYPRPVYYYNIPYEGESNLLRLRPSTFRLHHPYVRISSDKLTTKFISFDNDMNKLNNEILSINDDLKYNIENINEDIRSYNNTLKEHVENVFRSRKDQILDKRNQQQKLIVPLKRNQDNNHAYSAPPPKIKRNISPKPTVPSDKNVKPYPMLSDDDYKIILDNINGTGKALERKPSVYADKVEETLRDHILMNLEPVFDGSATGETFNQKGKTDILLRYQNDNIFIGECKFWKGGSSLIKTINQLLRYLTWRDSKTAIIMFVRNNDFSSIVAKAKDAMKEHPNYIKFENESDQTWFNYVFYLEGDKNKEIKIALMLYHMKPE
ncbi:hypothetical protein [Halalkalibacillus halophilus]|uniref:hypothetical protein n=1 Tax=Halalkalibacillus halophilus TaxID=392827 RepID=UPI0003F6B2A8|nr:hypothetical protein [Halalkalibacillus halophilus]